jgi:beta-fructofuranosidase
LTEENISRAMEETVKSNPDDPFRPGYHLLPPAGFMGDPNGGIWHDGWYHIFYLHNPFSGDPGPWYWAHARSRDLVHWEHLKPGITPPYEMHVESVISGSAMISGEGEPRAFYAASDAESMKFWKAAGSSDLLDWKTTGPVSGISLDLEGLPAFDGSWRDPFVFCTEGRTFMLLCADLFEESYVPLPIFEATDSSLDSWEYKGILFKYPKNRLRNLEVPELRPLGDKWVLTVSSDAPVDLTWYFVGELDLENLTFTHESEGPLDFSSHYYAQESIQDDQGNLYQMAWMSGWDREWMPHFREEDRKNTDGWWNGCFAIPRKLSLDESGKLIQQPVESIRQLRSGHVHMGRTPLIVENVLASCQVLEGVRGNQLELDLELDLGTASFCGLNLLCNAKGDGGLSLRWSGDQIIVDGIRIPMNDWEPWEPLRLQVFVDRQYVEIFLNGGQYCVTRKVKKNNILGDYTALAWLGGHASLIRLDAWHLESLK